MHSSISEGASTPTKKNSFLELYQMTSYDLAKKKTNCSCNQFQELTSILSQSHTTELVSANHIGSLSKSRPPLQQSSNTTNIAVPDRGRRCWRSLDTSDLIITVNHLSQGFEPRCYNTAVSVASHSAGWVTD
ncbi:hypothetical protein TNCV_2548731 [Trichonephila clavipes]|nr:hypothetical protein TNCV_2548731 [Trichonephila clavipes]